LPSVAIQCQLALLLAIAKEKEAAENWRKNWRRLSSENFGRFGRWKKNTTKRRLGCLAPSFCRPIGRAEEADLLYSPTLPNSPFFGHLYRARAQIQISPIKTAEMIAWTLNGSGPGRGNARWFGSDCSLWSSCPSFEQSSFIWYL